MMKRLLLVIMMMWTVGAFADTTAKQFVLVIDAGHGGKDTGCVGKISKEKNLTLKMALALGKMIERNCPDVKVIYTRKTDVFLELWQRAEIANKNKADLFVSVHINALPGGKIARGFQTYTLGRGRNSGKKGIMENLEVNSPESNIMFEFIQDTYMERSVELAKFMQRYMCAATGRANAGAHQDNLAVLRLSSMPGCLLELGFISTPDEERFMNSSEAPEQYARGFYNAFIAYKKKYFGGSATPFLNEPETPKTPKVEQPAKPKTEQPVKAQQSEVKKEQQVEIKKAEVSQSTAPQDAPVFKVQIMADTKAVPVSSSRFKGVKNIDSYKEGGYYKYTTGSSTDYNEIYRLRKSLLDKFPGAFIIAFKKGEKMDVTQAIREFKARRSQ